MENKDRQQQEWEFVLEGITTRMQTALEKQSEAIRWVCLVMLVTVFLVTTGFIVNNVIVINHINNLRLSGVAAHETVSQQRPGTDD